MPEVILLANILVGEANIQLYMDCQCMRWSAPILAYTAIVTTSDICCEEVRTNCPNTPYHLGILLLLVYPVVY